MSLSGDAAAAEGGEIVLRAELSRVLAEPLDVSWRIVPDGDPSMPDAEADDYETAGAATIPAGRTTASIEIAIVDDEDIEPARERFVVELDAPQNPNVGLSHRTRATATIQEGVCDRTPAVRDELTRNWQGCHWPRPLDLARVPALNLGGRGIDALRPNDLLGLDGLLRLVLRGNALATLPAGLLSETPRLRTLDLSDNAAGWSVRGSRRVARSLRRWQPGYALPPCGGAGSDGCRTVGARAGDGFRKGRNGCAVRNGRADGGRAGG